MGTPLLLGTGTFGVSYDADALNYFNANTSITSTADKNAINDFYLGLKSDGIYSKIKAMYLPIWGTAASSKWNLVNPIDSNAAYRLTFSTGWTFSSGGMTPNGTSAYADTFLTPSTSLLLNSTHLSYYSRTNVNITSVEMGAQHTNGLDYSIIQIRNSNLTYYLINSTILGVQSGADTNSQGFYLGTRTASNVINGFRNSTKILSGTTNSTSLPNIKIILGAFNSTSSIIYSTKQCSFSSIGDGLNDTEAANFYTRVNTLMTYFGINV